MLPLPTLIAHAILGAAAVLSLVGRLTGSMRKAVFAACVYGLFLAALLVAIWLER